MKIIIESKNNILGMADESHFFSKEVKRNWKYVEI